MLKHLCSPDNIVQAHLIGHALAADGLDYRIDGEYLQGGAGELQAGGALRIVVPEEHYLAAVAVLRDWEQSMGVNQPSQPSRHRGEKILLSALLLFFVFYLLVLWWQ